MNTEVSINRDILKIDPRQRLSGLQMESARLYSNS